MRILAVSEAKKNSQLEAEKQAALEAERKSVLTATLTPILELVDARAQLNVVKKLWGGGQIDRSPSLIKDEYLGEGLVLGLRYIYMDSAPVTAIWHRDGADGDVYTYSGVAGATLFDNEAALMVMASVKNNCPQITTLYRNYHFPKESFGVEGTTDYLHQYKTFDMTGVVDPSNKLVSEKVLEDQLFAFYATSGIPNPKDQRKQARQRIRSEKHMPLLMRIFPY